MIALFIFPLLLAFSPAAVWALRSGGLRRLWLLCALSLLAITLLALLLSAVYSVPSAWRVVNYFLAFLGPAILFGTGSLTLVSCLVRALPAQLLAGFAGSLIGLVAGFLVVVYVLGVW